MRLIILVATFFVCGSCKVTHREYLPLDSRQPTDLQVRGEVSIGDERDLNISLWFDSTFSQTQIDDMEVTISSKGKLADNASLVRMACTCPEINYINDERFRKKTFKELPNDLRLTRVDRFPVFYIFTFTGHSKVTASEVEVLYSVKLGDGNTINDKVTLHLDKSSRLSIH